MRPCVRTCACASLRAYVCVLVYAHIRVRVRPCVRKCARASLRAYVCACVLASVRPSVRYSIHGDDCRLKSFINTSTHAIQLDHTFIAR